MGLIALAGAGLLAGDASAETFSCRMGALVRQIEVRTTEAADDLACKVLYRKETEQPGVEKVLWTATSDMTFCTDKARDLVDKLEGYGWTCAAAAGEDRDQEIVEARVPPDLAPEPVPTLPAVAKPARKEDPVLQAAIAQDLTQLKDSAETVVEADVGAFGDLNRDGIEDAAVVITFDPDGADHAQYLVAYVHDGKSYRPAASKFLGGRYREVYGGQVAGIEDGDIFVDLQVLKADDPYCCPSGQQRAMFTLEGEDLLRRE